MYMHDDPLRKHPMGTTKRIGSVLAGLAMFVAIAGIVYVPGSYVYRHFIREKKMEYIYIVMPDEQVVMKSSTNTGVIVGAHHLIWTDLDGGYHHYRVSRENTAFILSEPHERYEKGKRKWLLETAEP